MKLFRLALTLAAAGYAVNYVMKQCGAASGGTPLLGYEPSAGGSTSDSTPASSTATPSSATTTVAADSPNGAERLQAQGVAETPAESRADADPLRSNSQEGAFAQKPGLADFARGA